MILDNDANRKVLAHAYSTQPFRVFSLVRLTRQPGEALSYPTIYSAFIFALRGQAKIGFDENVYTSQVGTVVHGRPRSLLAFEPLGEEAFEQIIIYYTAGHECDGSLASPMNASFSLRLDSYDETVLRLDALERIGRNGTMESWLNQIIGATALIKGLFGINEQRNAQRGVYLVRAYLDANFAQHVSLVDLAKIAEMSPDSLSYRFHRAFGIRPQKYLITKRMERASCLLQTDMLTKDVAAAVGYDDPFYFSRLFKKHFGFPPEAARRERIGGFMTDTAKDR
jgi:AraC-like DNA-binding protein